MCSRETGLFYEDIVLREKFQLYNNLAQSGTCTGRLSAEMQIYPSPRITWDFESLEDMVCQPEMRQYELRNPLVGKRFSIEAPIVTVTRGFPEAYVVSVGGLTPQAVQGDVEERFGMFAFYLPNARFQQINRYGTQQALWQHLFILGQEETPPVASMAGGLRLDCALDESSRISLETRQQALEWLDPQERSIGTFVTTVGWLSYSDSQAISLREAKDRLCTLGMLLSFANGGYTAPLYIEGVPLHEEGRRPSSVASVFRTTPIELLGHSWLAGDSSLEAFVQCFPTFERMIESSPWDEVFPLILSWYFQAIQPDSGQVRGKPRHVVANALGAALERLSFTILLESTGDRRGTVQDKVKKMINLMGIGSDCAFHKEEDIKSFFDVRNEATHPKPDLGIPNEERDRLINLAIVWIGEALLWRLGYDGKYHVRLPDRGLSVDPCYDLNKRDPNW
jgi:hypothetical protein